MKFGEGVLSDSGLAYGAIDHGESANVNQQVEVMQEIDTQDGSWDICHDENP